jgi:hypothetical protein
MSHMTTTTHTKKLLPILLVVSGAAAAQEKSGTCEFQDQDVPARAVAASKGAIIQVLATIPKTGGEVRRGELISVDVEYHVRDFKPGQFQLMPRFLMLDFGSSTGGDDGSERVLTRAHGRMRMCVPTTEAFERNNMRWPLELVMSINEMMTAESSRIIASSETKTFTSPDISAEAKAAQAAAPPKEYAEALTRAYNEIDATRALYELCSERSPVEFQKLQKPYRAYEARAAADIDFVTERQFEYVLRMMNGDRARAAGLFDSMSAAMRNYFRGLDKAAFDSMCEGLHARLTNSAPEAFLARDLKVLRAWPVKTP